MSSNFNILRIPCVRVIRLFVYFQKEIKKCIFYTTMKNQNLEFMPCGYLLHVVLFIRLGLENTAPSLITAYEDVLHWDPKQQQPLVLASQSSAFQKSRYLVC